MKSSDKKTLIFFIASILMGAAPACANTETGSIPPEITDINLNNTGVFEVDEDTSSELVTKNSEEPGKPPVPTNTDGKIQTLGELAANSVSDLSANPTQISSETKEEAVQAENSEESASTINQQQVLSTYSLASASPVAAATYSALDSSYGVSLLSSTSAGDPGYDTKMNTSLYGDGSNRSLWYVYQDNDYGPTAVESGSRFDFIVSLKDTISSTNNSGHADKYDYYGLTYSSDTGNYTYGGVAIAAGAALCLKNYTYMSFTTFAGNTIKSLSGTPYGGAIAVLGVSFSSSNLTFAANSSLKDNQQGRSAGGGAVFVANGGSFATTYSAFMGNRAVYTGSGTSAARGGAIYAVEGATVNLNNCFFRANSAYSSTYNALGGAISNDDGVVNISNSTFYQNQATTRSSYNARGGAIHLLDTLTLDNCSFYYNAAVAEAGTAHGGAIMLENSSYASTISDSEFRYNSAYGSVANGGAIYANGAAGSLNIQNCIFESNTSFGNGGALYLNMSAMIKDSRFEGNNVSAGRGGAIANNNSLILNGVVFTNNRDIQGENDIYNAGTIHIYGNVELHGGYKNNPDVNSYLYVNTDGILRIFDPSGHNSYDKTAIMIDGGHLYFETPKTIDILTMNFDGGALHLQNGGIDTLNISTGVPVSGTGTALYIDADLANKKSDFLNIASKQGNSDPILLAGIEILSDGAEKITTTALTSSVFAPYIMLSGNINITYASSVENTYLITYDNSTGILTFTSDGGNLKTTINDTTPLTRIYDMAENEEVDEGIGGMGGAGSVVTVNGNGYAVNGNGYGGLSLATGQTLNINNVSSWNGFSGTAINNGGTLNITSSNFTNNSNGSVIDNAGTLNITSSNFTNNSCSVAVVFNSGTVNITDTNFTNNTSAAQRGAAIRNTGTVTITASGSDVTFSGNKDANTNVPSDIYNSYGSIYFKGGKNTYLNGGLYSYYGSIYKQDSGTLYLYGNNIGYGDVNVALQGGSISFNKTAATDSYIGGTTTISSGANLYYNTSVADTLPCTLSGSGNFYKQGTGTLTITGNQSGYSGQSTINGGKIYFTGSAYFSGQTNINGNTLEFALSSDQSYGNFITGNGSFIKSGSGKLTVTGVNNGFTGTTTINQGTIQYNSSSGSTYFGGQTNVNGNTLIFNLSTNESYSNKFYGSGNFYKQGSGTLTLTGTNSGFTGTTTIQGGTIQYNSSSGSSYLGGQTNINGNTLIFNLSTNESHSNKFYGSGSFIKQGTGTLTLTGNNSGFTGLTTIQGGTIQYNSSSGSSYLGGQTNVNGNTLIFNLTTNESISNNKFYGSGNFYKQGTGTLTLSGTNNGFTGLTTMQGGTIQYNSSNGSSYFGGQTNINGNTLIFNLSTNESHSNKFYGTGSFIKQGSGTLTLTGNNSSFTGTTTIQAGTIYFDKNSTTDTYFGGSTVNNGTLTYDLATADTIKGTMSGSGTFNKTGTATLTLSGNNSGFGGTTNINQGTITFTRTTTGDQYFGGTTNIYGTLNFDIQTDYTLSGKLAQNGTFNKTGSGTLTITGDNSAFVGTTNINAGSVLFIKDTAANKYFGGKTILNGGTLEYRVNAAETLAGTVSGTGNIIKSGTSTLTITSNNSGFTGTTYVNSGRLIYSQTSSTDKYFGGSTNIATSGTLEFNLSTDLTFTNAITGTGIFNKKGNATLTLSGNHGTFGGTTIIDAGKIIHRKNSASDTYFGGTTTINTGGTLEYALSTGETLTGTINGGGNFIKSGNAELIITGNNSGFTGTTTITGGIVTFNKNNATDKYFGGSTIINGGTTLNYNINVSDTLPSRISGSGTFNKTGSGTLSVTGDQSGFSGIANINGGILNFNKTTTTDKFFAGITNVNANSTLEYTTGINDTLNGKINGEGTFKKEGTATLYLSGNNSGFSGQTIIDAGSLVFNKNTINDTYFGGTTIINGNGTLEYNLSAADTINGNVSGSGVLKKSGNSTLTLSGNNSNFTGTTVIDGGKITFNKTANTEYFGGTTTINAGGELQYITTTSDKINGTINGSGTLRKQGTATLTLTGNNSGFSGITYLEEGIIEFEKTAQNTYLSGITDISKNGTLNYKTTVDDRINGTIKGEGALNKQGTGTLTLGGNNSGFFGITTIENGKIVYNNNSATDSYFGGKTIINANTTLEFVNNENGDLTSDLSGNGVFNKTGSKELEIKGEQKNFTGIVNITGGKMSFTTGTDKSFFNSSAINILGSGEVSSLEYTSTNSGNFDRLVNLQGNAALTLNAESGSIVTLNNLVTTTGNNNKTYFNNGTFVFATDYSVYGSSGEGNKLTFTNTTAKLDTTIRDFGSTELNAEFNNSVLDMRNDNGNTNAHGIGDAKFNTLTLTGNNTLYVDMDLKNHPDQNDPTGEKPESDRLIVGAGSSGEIDLKGVSVTVDGRWAYEEVQIIEGTGVTIKDFEPYLSATSTNYIYEITKSEKDGYVIVSTVDYEDDPTKNPETLKVMHQATSNRAFNVNANNPHYMVLSNLGKMGTGEFYVSGISNTTSIIDANNLWSLFNADSTDGTARELEIGAVKIQNAVINILSGRVNGSALYVNGTKSTVQTNTTAFLNNSALSGGAVYNNGGNLIMTSTSLINNSATINGGAAYFNGGINKIENSELMNNSSRSNAGAVYNKSADAKIIATLFGVNSAKNGGAVYNENTLTVIDSTFDGNEATNSGGAIYNEGTLTVEATEGKKTRFYNNKAAHGGDIYNDNGIINFTGKGTIEIETGIAGTGEINKNETGTLIIRGENNDYAGKVIINNGKIILDKITETDSYLGGTTEITETGTLEYDLTVEENMVGINAISGNGIFRKKGDANLNLSGQNNAFEGEMNIAKGNLNYTQSTNGSYFGGKTSIEAGATLNFTNTQDDKMQDLSGMGTFNKNGKGIAIITGNNANFIGITNLNEGTLKYAKTEETEEFIKGKINVNNTAALELNLNKSEIIGGNIYGTGIINKTGTETWIIRGDNSVFSGTTIINEGEANFEKTAQNTYLGGTTTINENGTLKYITSENDVIEGTINGNGTFIKDGTAELTLSGKNNVFGGHTIIENGIINYQQSYGGSYFSSSNEIRQNGVLNFTNNSEDNVNTLSSTGTLNKNGSGTLNLNKNNINFAGTININEGKITYNKITNEDNFISGTVNVGEKTELEWNLNLDDTIKATINGTGTIQKTGAGVLTLSGENKDFTGLFDIKNTTVVYDQSIGGSYFGGATDINYGTTLIFKNSADDYIKDIQSSGVIKTGDINNTYGAFIKEGTGTLYLSGDNSNYTGTVTINEGTLAYDDQNNKFFASQEIDIEGTKGTVAKLEYTKNDAEANWDTHVNLNGNANLTVKGLGNGVNKIEVNQPPKTTGNNNETVFTQGIFEFNNAFKEYGKNSTNTKITFDDMTFELSENVNDFGQSELNAVFNNSVINTKNDKLDTMTFGDLTLSGTNTWHIDLDLKNNPDQHLPGATPEADKIIAETGSGVITLGAIKIVEDGRWKLQEIELVDAGNVIIEDFEKYTQFTSNGYEYDISKSEKNEGAIIISTTDYNPGEETLKKAHKYEGDRGFNISNSASTTENGVYVVLSNLETMGAGRFDVSGLDKTTNTITGNHEWALFNADSSDGKDRILNIYDLTISDAITDINCGRTDGAAVHVKGPQSEANIQNTIFYNNNADERGGAIYNENGKVNVTLADFNENSAKNGGAAGNSGIMKMEGVTFNKNTATNNGGAALNTGELEIKTGEFSENIAQNNGGALYNSGTTILTDVNFKNNTAQTGKGGAIYNEGTVTIIANENHLVEFENNKAGIDGSDIHNENGIINFAGSGITAIKSGITGTGEINKNESGTLLLGGKNHTYTGQTNINDGILYFEKTTDTTYLGGQTTINANGTLIYETTENDTINGTINGAGTFKKYGTNTLTLSGNNSNFTGHAHLYEGYTSFTKTENSTYLGGQTTIHENAQLEYNTEINDTITGTIDGEGYLKKTGSGTLTLNGNNSNFTGLTTIDAGRLVFDKNTETDLQLGGNTLVNAGGTLEYDLEIDDEIKGNVFGEGNFEKTGSATLTLSGNNSGFKGTTTIKEGTIAFEKTENNTYLGGNTIIESNATLEYTTTQNDLVNGTISGSGTLQKYGANTLILSGNNSLFTGQTNLHEGTIYFEKTETSNYLGGQTTINENGTLIYNTTTEDTINGTINGSGTFIKTGENTLTLTGNNKNFSGAAYIENGTVKYEQSTNGSYISGSTYIANTAKLDLNNQQNDKLQNISGFGIINKTGDGSFTLDGINKDFLGTLNINKGEISYQQSENGSYINGLTNIDESGTLRINITKDESLTYFSGKGSIIKEGPGTAIITGNNSSFTGTTTIDNGKILFNRKYANDEYFHDKTTINESGELQFNLDANYILSSKLYGTGQFTKTGSGTLYLNGWNQNFKGTVNLNEGTITLLPGASMFAMDKLNMNANTLLDTRNNTLDNINLHNITVSGERANLGIDININTQKGDCFSADSFKGSGKLVINHISILDDAFRNSNTINIINPENNFAQNVMLDPTLSTLEGKIYRYDTSYNPATGNLTLTSAGGNNYKSFSPSILSSNVGALVGGYLMQLNSYDEAFANMDMLMLMPQKQRNALFLKNKIAANDAIIAFSPALIPEENKGAWYRTSTAMEKVPLKNGPKVNNIMYNSYFGIDSPIKTLKHGINATYTAYAGYTGSHQTYDGVSLYQNGITAGTTAAFYYNNFFSAITANGGAIMTDASGIWGTDHPFMVTAGIASKSGYNWETLDGRLIIQPNLQVSYTFVNLFDYTNKAGVNLQTKPLNSVQVIPGIKIIANLPSGWMPYMGVNVVTNIMNETNFKANDVMLPEMSVRPFVSYGLGVQKRWGERFTGFVQTMFRSGGREGVSFSFGLRWAI